MVRPKKKNKPEVNAKQPERDKRDEPIDPYTGEVEPPAEGAYKVTEIVSSDPGNREGENYLLEEEDSLDPSLSAGDVDAAWEDSIVAGEESVGGSAPTPDQDNVDEIGEAAGVTYQDDEPLNSDKKILGRDRGRWELNPASTDDQDEDTDEE